MLSSCKKWLTSSCWQSNASCHGVPNTRAQNSAVLGASRRRADKPPLASTKRIYRNGENEGAGEEKAGRRLDKASFRIRICRCHGYALSAPSSHEKLLESIAKKLSRWGRRGGH